MSGKNGECGQNGEYVQKPYTAEDSALGRAHISNEDRCMQTAEVITGEVLPAEVRFQFTVLYDDTPRNSDDNRLPKGIV